MHQCGQFALPPVSHRPSSFACGLRGFSTIAILSVLRVLADSTSFGSGEVVHGAKSWCGEDKGSLPVYACHERGGVSILRHGFSRVTGPEHS